MAWQTGGGSGGPHAPSSSGEQSAGPVVPSGGSAVLWLGGALPGQPQGAAARLQAAGAAGRPGQPHPAAARRRAASAWSGGVIGPSGACPPGVPAH